MRNIYFAGLLPALAAFALAGCSGFGSPKSQEPVPAASDPNAFPANYKTQLAMFLPTVLIDRADFRGAQIAQPVLKPVGDSQHYVVCLQFNGHNERKNKVAIYLSGSITQFINPTPQQCGDAAYQPFQELEAELPRLGN